MRLLVLAIGFAGCGFSGSPVDPTDTDASSDATVSDASGADTINPDTVCRGSAANVIACYDFENDVTDGSLAGHEGATLGDPRFVPAQVGLGIELDGDDAVLVADSADFDAAEITIEVWFTPNALPSNNSERLLWDTQSQFALMLFDDDGRVRCGAAGAPQGTFADGAAQVGVPMYLACTLSSTELRVYVDGQEVGSEPRGIPLFTDPTDGSIIGADLLGGGSRISHFEGVIDTLRLSSVALTQEQICDAAGIEPDECD